MDGGSSGSKQLYALGCLVALIYTVDTTVLSMTAFFFVDLGSFDLGFLAWRRSGSIQGSKGMSLSSGLSAGVTFFAPICLGWPRPRRSSNLQPLILSRVKASV
jgi:hypothetical protein